MAARALHLDLGDANDREYLQFLAIGINRLLFQAKTIQSLQGHGGQHRALVRSRTEVGNIVRRMWTGTQIWKGKRREYTEKELLEALDHLARDAHALFLGLG